MATEQIGTLGSRNPSPTKQSLTKEQIDVIVAFERAGASLSLLGILAVFITYALLKRFRTVPNTFIVFASFANLGASVACLIGYSGIEQGSQSALCQTQAFMFELFMQSDPWWSFAMAINVYMVFFFAADPKSFLSYWWAYFAICYGFPFLPALWLLLIRDDPRGYVYGNATIWCWIDQSWSNLRIYTYYLPIWVCILLSTCIYISVGYYVFKQRNQLRNLSLSNLPRDQSQPQRDSVEKNLSSHAAVMGVATEVRQTTTLQQENHPHTTETAAAATSQSAAVTASFNWPEQSNEDVPPRDLEVESRVSPTTFHTVTRITAEPRPKSPIHRRLRKSYFRMRSKLSNMDPVKLAYLRTSFVFAISVLITWTPSSINRVHDLVHSGKGASYALNLASGIVLPLQGVWNSVIFFSTSATLVKMEIRFIMDRFRGIPRGNRVADAIRCEQERNFELNRRRKGQNDDAGSEATGSTMRIMREGSLGDMC